MDESDDILIAYSAVVFFIRTYAFC